VEKLSKARTKKAAAPGGKKQAKSKSKTNPDSTNDDNRAASKKSLRRNEWLSSLFCLCGRNFILWVYNIHTLMFSLFCGGCYGLFSTMAASQSMWNIFYLLVSHEYHTSN
jgi:hypothetical protein